MYQQEEPVTLWVNKVDPYNNPQETYNYYNLPFCHPSDNLAHKWGGHGEVLGGNELIDSRIDIKFRNDLPLWGFVGELRPDKNSDNGKHFLFTHKNILIKYNQDQIIHVNLTQEGPKPLEGVRTLDMTYSVKWEPTNVTFGRRFDVYLDYPFFEHQLALLVLLVILLAIVGMLYVGRRAIVTTFIVTIVGTYFLLNAENYHWQWTSFFSAASTAVYVYLYSIYYFYEKTKMSGFFQTSFYFGYTLMFCLGLGILCVRRERIAERIRALQDLVPSVNKLEDELADNGVSLLTVKVRVMPSSWFLLLRFWLRVDRVLIRLRDTHMHCIFGGAENPVILRETCWRESTFEALSMIFGTEAAYSEEDIDLVETLWLAIFFHTDFPVLIDADAWRRHLICDFEARGLRHVMLRL
ncbi:hypothetical protein K1719_020505 [Acacia pycnantha]|nr:hypothetical protein K1719_020505 [Acacia pycnantha]